MIIIDRIESTENGSIAVCELDSGEMVNIPESKFAYTPHEGDCIYESGGKYHLDIEVTNKRKEKMKKLFDSVFKAKN